VNRSRARAIAVQVVAFAIGLALLAWCVTLALRPENRDKFALLAGAPRLDVAALFALSLASVLLNGGVFWAVLHPVRRLRLADIEAVNAVATFLNYLPFKLGLVFRVAVHTRRDGVPLLTVAAWMAAMGVIVLGSMVPPLAAGLWRGRIDALFVVSTLAGLGLFFATTLAIARAFSGERGLARLGRLAARTRVGLARRAAASTPFARLHAGFAMLATPATLALAITLRTADLLIQAGRFVIASRIVHEPITFETAVLAASSYFLIGVLSPAGTVGAREGGTIGLASLLRGVTPSSFAVIALVVSATELAVHFFTAAAGTLWLRPDRLLRLRAAAPPA